MTTHSQIPNTASLGKRLKVESVSDKPQRKRSFRRNNLWEFVPAALGALRKGGTLVLGGIHMSPIPSFDYELLYQERVIRSVANNTRQDGLDFLRLAAQIPIRTQVQMFDLKEANQALSSLKNDAIRGAAVLKV